MSHNGQNNRNGLARQTHHVQQEPPDPAGLMKPPPWLQALRDSMSDAIKGEDLQAIMAAQVRKARDGDRSAAAFVFNQAHKMMASEQQKRVTIVQNNYYDGSDDPQRPVEAPPDSHESIRAMRDRARAGLPLRGNRDRDPRAISDEEEKALRRRQQEQEANDDTGPEGD